MRVFELEETSDIRVLIDASMNSMNIQVKYIFELRITTYTNKHSFDLLGERNFAALLAGSQLFVVLPALDHRF